MKKLSIRNLGPVREAEIELGRTNVIIGQQSAEKSCVLKTASFCAWAEKKIELAQSCERFEEKGSFLRELLTFHRMTGYGRKDTRIGYETDFMKLCYDNSTGKLAMEWKEKRWDYRRPQIAYIPTERNIVATIPNWMEVRMDDDNVRGFMVDWEEARSVYGKGVDILNLDVTYRYDKASHSDLIDIGDGREIGMINASSGLQSAVPLYVYVDFITGLRDRKKSVVRSIENMHFMELLYEHLMPEDKRGHDYKRMSVERRQVPVLDFGSGNDDIFEEYRKELPHFTVPQHCELFIEEPENNLFPPTQCRLAEWLMEKAGDKHQLFIATHSPYILSTFVESKPDDFRLLFLKRGADGMTTVRTATPDDISEINYYGTDPFINIEAYNE